MRSLSTHTLLLLSVICLVSAPLGAATGNQHEPQETSGYPAVLGATRLTAQPPAAEAPQNPHATDSLDNQLFDHWGNFHYMREMMQRNAKELERDMNRLKSTNSNPGVVHRPAGPPPRAPSRNPLVSSQPPQYSLAVIPPQARVNTPAQGVAVDSLSLYLDSLLTDIQIQPSPPGAIPRYSRTTQGAYQLQSASEIRLNNAVPGLLPQPPPPTRPPPASHPLPITAESSQLWGLPQVQPLDPNPKIPASAKRKETPSHPVSSQIKAVTTHPQVSNINLDGMPWPECSPAARLDAFPSLENNFFQCKNPPGQPPKRLTSPPPDSVENGVYKRQRTRMPDGQSTGHALPQLYSPMDEVGRHTPVIGTLGWPLAPTDHRQRSSSLTAELTSSWPTVRSGQSFSSSTAISDTPTLDHATVVRRGIEIAERWQVQDLDDLLLRKPYLDDPERSWVKCKFQIDEAMRGPYLVLRAHLPAVQYTSAATPSSGTGPNRLQGEDTRASLPPPAERAVYEVVYLPDTPLHDCRGQMERWAKASSQSTIRWVDMTNKVELMAVKYLLTIYPGNENQETVKETINGIQLRIDALRNPAKLMARF